MWRTRCPCPCFVSLSGLSCTTCLCIWLPFLPYAYYMWLPWFVLFLFLGFSPPESRPGDDVLCRLLSRPLPSVCFLFFSFPTVFVPNLFWCNFLYLVTTAGFVADQLGPVLTMFRKSKSEKIEIKLGSDWSRFKNSWLRQVIFGKSLPNRRSPQGLNVYFSENKHWRCSPDRRLSECYTPEARTQQSYNSST